MNKRDTVLSLANSQDPPGYVPAAFFLHFDPAYHRGQAAIDKHLEFFRSTGMDFVKIQYENPLPPGPLIQKPEDWAKLPLYPQEFHEAPVRVAEGLVKAAKGEALVIMTMYSPFMWAMQAAGSYRPGGAPERKPQRRAKGTGDHDRKRAQPGARLQAGGHRWLLRLHPRAAKPSVSPARRSSRNISSRPTWRYGMKSGPAPSTSCTSATMTGGYDDLTPFLDYPGQVVNSSLKLGDRTLSPKEISEMFGRPFMGGMDRQGAIADRQPG